MSKALCCDRCGRCFNPAVADYEFITIKEYIVQDGEHYRKNEVVLREEEQHLCGPCSAMHERFMEGQTDLLHYRGEDENDEKASNNDIPSADNPIDEWFEWLKGRIDRRARDQYRRVFDSVCPRETPERPGESEKDGLHRGPF